MISVIRWMIYRGPMYHLMLRCLAVVAALLLLIPSAAEAESGRIGDSDDDGNVPVLDFRHIELANNESAAVVTMWFNKVTVGDLAVRLMDTDGHVVGAFSRHRHPGDRNHFGSTSRDARCRGWSVTWDAEHDKARVRIPARCINDGEYGDLRAKVITELGSDADLVPDARGNSWPWSRYIARG